MPFVDLLQYAIDGHGGTERWASVRAVCGRVSIGGRVWARKGIPEVSGVHEFHVLADSQHTTMDAFGSPTHIAMFDGERTVIRDSGTETIVDERSDPRSSVDASGAMARWRLIDAVYFLGYSLSNYIRAPHLFSRRGFETRELTGWNENGESWRRLAVTFPPDLATHCRSQIFYFDTRGLLRRQDYQVDIMGGDQTVAHYADDHHDVTGLQFPLTRRIHAINDGVVDRSYDIISLDFSDLRAINRNRD